MPYSPRKSPTPTNGGITSSTSSTNPPPLPRKKMAPKSPAGEGSSITLSGNQSKIQDVPRSIFSPKEKPPQLQTRGRSQTVALDRKSQNYCMLLLPSIRGMKFVVKCYSCCYCVHVFRVSLDISANSRVCSEELHTHFGFTIHS